MIPEDFLNLDSAMSLPCRTDIIAYNAGFVVSALPINANEKAIFKDKSIKYNPSIPVNEIRALIALGMVLLTNPFFKEEIIIDEPIYNQNFRFADAMKKVAMILVTKENIETYLYDLKIYSIQQLAVEFGVSEELMYHRLKDLKKL